MINKRIFGSDIPNKVKKKLETRQLLAEKARDPNESITETQYKELLKLRNQWRKELNG